MIKMAVACYDTLQNDRTKYTISTYESLQKTINKATTEVYFIDNDSCSKTKNFLKSIKDNVFHVITNKINAGTANAINEVIKIRNPKDYVIKCDNDVNWYQYGWADEMADCIEKDNKIGILGLKRKDLDNFPESIEYPTELKMLSHERGQSWRIIEICKDIIGTCTMYNPLLLDKVGYLYQPGIYAFDDNLMSHRSLLAGFYNAFYPRIEIDHIDTGATPYTEWKKMYAGLYLDKIGAIMKEYEEGKRSIYYNPFK